MKSDTPTHTRLATRRIGARVGAVDEYTALQMAAMDRLVHCGLEVTAATASGCAEQPCVTIRSES